MATIIVKDGLRQSVEAASGGKQTVLYTAKGQPSFVNIVPRETVNAVNSSWTGTTPHPAFIVGGKTYDYLYVGTYQGVIVNGELLSLPNRNPVGVSYLNGWTAAKAAGAGWHMMTAVEYALLTALSLRDGAMEPQGNTNGAAQYWGASGVDTTQYGVRQDGKAVTADNGNSKILTGTGPLSFRHNQSFNGISDLVGNYYSWITGSRVMGGEFQQYMNNDFAAVAVADLMAALVSTTYTDGTGWQAFSATSAAQVTPTFTGALSTSNYTPGAGTIQLASAAANIGTSKIYWPSFGNMLLSGAIQQAIPAAALQYCELMGGTPQTSYLSRGMKYSNTCGWSIDNSTIRYRVGGQTGIIGGSYAITQADTINGTGNYSGRPIYYPV